MHDLSQNQGVSTDVGSSFVPTTEAFGARLALIRWQMGWNQKEAALACRLPQGSWREWELSGRAPRSLVEVAGKIAEATGIDDYWIMTGKQNSPRPGGGAKAAAKVVRREGIEPPTR